ncbi:methyltransferase [Mycolicibacter minnesotensis]
MAGWGSQVVRTLAVLSIAEHFEVGPRSADEIAERCSSDPAMTSRLLRAATALGFLTYDRATAKFTETAMLLVLRADSPFGLKNFVMSCGGPAFWRSAVQLPETVMRGHNYLTGPDGMSLWDYFDEHQAEGQLFQRAITDLSIPVIADAVREIEVGQGRLVVDVGGARGAFVGALLQRHPQLSGVVLDREATMAGAAEEAHECGLGERMTGVAGDFFASVPPGDIFLLKFILHDWDDVSCVTILQNIREAMNPGARLYIVEMDIAPDPRLLPAALMDLVMMFTLSGRERDTGEYEQLLAAAGLELSRTVPLRHPYQLLEARAAVE